jgi:hypothetical protein
MEEGEGEVLDLEKVESEGGNSSLKQKLPYPKLQMTLGSEGEKPFFNLTPHGLSVKGRDSLPPPSGPSISYTV